MIDKIKQALGEELAAQVAEKLGDIELGIVNDGTLVPAEKHDGMKAELKATQEQLKSATDSLKDLEGSTDTIEELKAQIKAKTDEFEAFKADTDKREVTRTKTAALTKALEDAGAVKESIDLLTPTFDLDKIQLDNSGAIVDVADLINPVKESRKGLFSVTKPRDNPPPQGQSTVDTDSMTDAEFLAYKTKGK